MAALASTSASAPTSASASASTSLRPHKSRVSPACSCHRFDALAKTAGWVPHNANLDGSQRAVYDPVAHKTTMYTFNGTRVSRQEGKGDRSAAPLSESLTGREAA